MVFRAFTNSGSSKSSPFITFPSRRSVVHSTKGIVSCTSPLATQAGLRVLREGGNAADAAVATAAVLNVVDPSMTGIGGDVFSLFYNAKTYKVHSLNGTGRSPAAATLDAVCQALQIVDPANAAIPHNSVHSVTIPGAAAAWVDMVEKFGSKKVSLEQVLMPAIELAEGGFPVSQIAAQVWVSSEEELRNSPHGFELLKPDPESPRGCRAPREGEIVHSPLLASTFRQLTAYGKAGFYEGAVAQAIIDATESRGGFHTLEDLQYHGSHGSDINEAISLQLGKTGASDQNGTNTINGIQLWESPPNGQGIVALMSLGIIQHLEESGRIPKLSGLEHNSAEYLHIVIESLRIAFADASWFVTDPNIPEASHPEKLLSPAYLAERAKIFDPTKASNVMEHGSPAFQPSDTVYLAVTDSDGNGCSLVNSLADRFGSGIVPAGTGFALQNRGAGFRLDKGHPNVFEPGKRPFNTIIPAIITNTKDQSLKTVYGVMGGFMQPQGHLQVLLNMEVFGFNPQEALDAPRICIGAPIPGKSLDPTKIFDMSVYLEEGISGEVVRKLETMGHATKLVTGQKRSLFGRGQVINVGFDPVSGQKVYSAGSDPRGDGAAAPL